MRRGFPCQHVRGDVLAELDHRRSESHRARSGGGIRQVSACSAGARSVMNSRSRVGRRLSIGDPMNSGLAFSPCRAQGSASSRGSSRNLSVRMRCCDDDN